jgi:hypothetical protein
MLYAGAVGISSYVRYIAYELRDQFLGSGKWEGK